MEQVILKLSKNLLEHIDKMAKAQGLEIDVLVQRILKDYIKAKAKTKPPLSPLEQSRDIHATVKANITKKYPHLKEPRSQKEVQKQFDNITEKIRQKMQYETLEELEKVIRGDKLGLVRY